MILSNLLRQSKKKKKAKATPPSTKSPNQNHHNKPSIFLQLINPDYQYPKKVEHLLGKSHVIIVKTEENNSLGNYLEVHENELNQRYLFQAQWD